MRIISLKSQNFNISGGISSAPGIFPVFNFFLTSWYSSIVNSPVLMPRFSNITGISSFDSLLLITGSLPSSWLKWLYQLLTHLYSFLLLFPFWLLCDHLFDWWIFSFVHAELLNLHLQLALSDTQAPLGKLGRKLIWDWFFHPEDVRSKARQLELANLISKQNISILGISDHKIVHEGKYQSTLIDNCTLITSSAWRNSNNASSGGVGLLVNGNVESIKSEIEPV